MTASGPLDLTAWRDRLISKVPRLRSVGLSADLAATRGSLRNTPQAFVVPVSDQPVSSPGPGNSVITQNIKATVAVVIAIANQRGAREGSSASEDVQNIRSEIFEALIGWTPPGATHAIQFAGGRSVDYQDSTVLFSDRFVSAYFIRKEYSQ